MNDRLTILTGDAIEQLRTLPDNSVQVCCTSPPYWGMRDYKCAGQIGLEPTFDLYIQNIVAVFREVRRVLKPNGTLWVNVGDSYAQSGGPGWQGKNGQRADRRFTLVRDTVPMRAATRRPPAGTKPKDLIGIPWAVAFALRADGWWLRQDIIWSKPAPMPESIRDRCTKSHEYLFLLSKSQRYYWDFNAMQEPTTGHAHRRSSVKQPAGWAVGEGPHTSVHLQANGHHRKTKAPGVTPKSARPGSGIKANESFHAVSALVTARNRRSVWTIPSEPYSDAHFAVFPPDLVKPCILAGSRPGDVVLDPFFGSGTTGMVAIELGRNAIGIELNPEYVELAKQRCNVTPGLPLFTPTPRPPGARSTADEPSSHASCEAGAEA